MDLSDGIQPYLADIDRSRTGHWLAVGAAVLGVYDWLVCLDLEVQYIWKARWSAGKVLYHLHRYPIIIVGAWDIYFNTGAPPVSWCKAWIPATYAFDLAVVFCVQITLCLRVWALYEKSRNVMLSLTALMLANVFTTAVLFVMVTRKLFYHTPAKPLSGCYPDCHHCFQWIPMLHMPILAADTVIVAFTLVKCARYFFKDRLKLPTLKIVFRDGLFYYVVSFLIILFNILFLYFVPAAMSGWFLPWMRTVVGIMGTRILLNLRGQIEDQRHDTQFFMHAGDISVLAQSDLEHDDHDDRRHESISLDNLDVEPSPTRTDTPLYRHDEMSALRARIAQYWTAASPEDDSSLSPSSSPTQTLQVVRPVPPNRPKHVPLRSGAGSGDSWLSTP